MHVHARAARQSAGAACRAPAPSTLGPARGHRAGAELPAPLREPSAGRGFSFAGVRVHHDGAAHRLADDAGARAFVADRHIFFRAGQYAPGTAAGRALIEHELAHLPEAAGDAGHIYRAPLYDTREWDTARFPPPPRGLTVAAFRQQIQLQRVGGAAPAITGFQIVGAATDEQQLFLLNLIWHMASRDGWDRVTQVQAQIGWPRPLPRAAPQPSPAPEPAPAQGSAQAAIVPTGVVRLSIDAQGAARVELLSPIVALAPAAAINEPRAAVVARLQNEFGVAQVLSRSATFGDGELRDVLGALTLLTGADRDALRGVSLVRVATLAGGFAGEFDGGGGLTAGGMRVARGPELRLANSAFPRSDRVLGDANAVLPASFQIILHEVGHAVERQRHRAAMERANQAAIRNNRAAEVSNDALAAWRTAYAGHRAGTVTRAELDRSRSAYDTAQAAYVTARAGFNRAQGALRALEIPDALVAPVRTAATNAESAFRRALAGATTAAAAYAQPAILESAAYRSAVAAVTQAVERYKAGRDGGNRLALEQVVQNARTARSTARAALQQQNATHPALGDFAPVDAAQDQWWEAERIAIETSGRTLRLQRFVDLVVGNNILPLTPYARDNWPHRPGEFYAETYALWRTDPAFLQAHYPALFTFFDGGAYLR